MMMNDDHDDHDVQRFCT